MPRSSCSWRAVLAVPGCWITQKHPQSLFSVAMGTLTLPCRCLCLITPSGPLFSSPPKSNSGIQGPTAFSSFFFFGHSLSFCFAGFKATENLQPGATDSSAEERQWGAQHWLGPNTKYNPPPSPGSVLHTLKTGDLAESLTPQPASLHGRKGLTILSCRMRRPKSQKPSAQSRQVEAGIGSMSVSVCMCLCVCLHACAQQLLSRLGDSTLWQATLKPPSWIISNSCAHLGWEKKPPRHDLGPLPCLVTAPDTRWTTNKQQCQHLKNRCPGGH